MWTNKTWLNKKWVNLQAITKIKNKADKSSVATEAEFSDFENAEIVKFLDLGYGLRYVGGAIKLYHSLKEIMPILSKHRSNNSVDLVWSESLEYEIGITRELHLLDKIKDLKKELAEVELKNIEKARKLVEDMREISNGR